MTGRTEGACRRAAVAAALLGLATTSASAGNQALMAQERDKAFLMNRAVLEKLDLVKGQAAISLQGRVKQMPDGQWQVVIDGLDVHRAVEPGTFPFNPPPDGSYIQYMPFERMTPGP